jgi:large subunit ribosomal protein L9
MGTTIQVILREDMENVGASGELVKVRPGFARNFLLPRGHAVPATTAQINRINHEKAVAVVRNEKLKKESQDVAAKIEALKIKIARPAGDDGKLFGSVTAKDIHAAAVAAGATFDKKKMHLKEAIRAVGTYEVAVKLVPGVSANLKVEIVAK